MNEDKTPATMENHTDKFLETGNFAYAISAFCRARKNGHSIPEEILKALEEAFLKWGENDGKKSLDEILGMRPGRGKKSILHGEWTKQRNERLFMIMATLIGLGWRPEDAAEGACAWLHRQYEANPEKYRWLKPSKAGREKDDTGTILDAKSLLEFWRSSKYKAQRIDGELRVQTRLICWTEQEKVDYQRKVRKWMGKV